MVGLMAIINKHEQEHKCEFYEKTEKRTETIWSKADWQDGEVRSRKLFLNVQKASRIEWEPILFCKRNENHCVS